MFNLLLVISCMIVGGGVAYFWGKSFGEQKSDSKND
ncbi:hypothetical protein BCL52_1908 [Salisediminibacterium halotolerans]|nr:hypothetical protein BCL39_1911 [Actinophytocola xinjiangensis]RPE86584.1 hypothetical protein EDD67_2034 [Salisediminibacterium halotolerans]TWG33959.1 hypothetical protein BCL52_1908 [Salisediminibacterium halotolerans]